jgi:hypothetical protein
VQDACENFLHPTSCNETFWCGECAHILVIGQMIMIPYASLVGCKFCHDFPFYVVDYSGQIYYVVHKLQSMSRAMIHVGVHNHPVAMESVGNLLRRLEG